jgi:hypothetical protein
MLNEVCTVYYTMHCHMLPQEKRDDLQRAKAQVTAIRGKYYKETGELQRQ